MNTGQMLMTIGAMVLLSTLILRVNTNFAENSDTVYNSKYEILASSLGNSIIEEASGKAFDQVTTKNPISSLTGLTLPASLGLDSGEVYPYFDDFDDYNNFTKIDSTLPSAVFKINCKVQYVTPDDLDGASLVCTWTKKITVTVTSISMADTVRLSSLYSYWVFR